MGLVIYRKLKIMILRLIWITRLKMIINMCLKEITLLFIMFGRNELIIKNIS